MWSWMEVGGLPAHPEEEAKRLFAKASSLPSLHSAFLSPLLTCYWTYPITVNSYISFLLAISPSFQGLILLHQASQKREEAWKLEEEGAAARDGGVGEHEGGSGRIRGGRSLWAPEGSHIILPPCPHPNLLIKKPHACLQCHSFPSHCPLKSPQDLKPQILQIRPLCPPLQLLLQLQRKTHWPTCNPLEFKWGVQNECISAGLKVAKRAHQPHGQLSVPMWEKYIWGWGWCAPSVQQDLLQPRMC